MSEWFGWGFVITWALWGVSALIRDWKSKPKCACKDSVSMCVNCHNPWLPKAWIANKR